MFSSFSINYIVLYSAKDKFSLENNCNFLFGFFIIAEVVVLVLNKSINSQYKLLQFSLLLGIFSCESSSVK